MREALSVEQLRCTHKRLARRYDFQHTLVTARADQRGRSILIENSVVEGNRVLDCGSGTGTTGIMAAKKVGSKGKVTLFDLSDAMLAIAREKVIQEGLQNRVTFQTGDMVHLPFAGDCFDVVLSTYSLCPLYDPEKGAQELYRVTNPGGRIAIAHHGDQAGSLVAQGFDGGYQGSLFGWINPKHQSNCDGDANTQHNRKRGNNRRPARIHGDRMRNPVSQTNAEQSTADADSH